MKFCKLLETIKLNPTNLGNCINYDTLKLSVNKSNFISFLIRDIEKFDIYYLTMKNIQDVDHFYEFLIINYLIIRNLLKKMKKYSNINYDFFIKEYKNVDLFFSKFIFYKDILNFTNFNICPLCKNEINIDHDIIFLDQNIICNSLIGNHNISLDIVSDLHIDQWSSKYKTPYPLGTIKEYPFIIQNPIADVLIVAGDISDDLNNSILYLNELSKHYKKILFIDGNHEHVCKYPNLYTIQDISNLITNDNIIYLSLTPYKIHDTIFIGACGWWDYDNYNPKSIKHNLNYFDNWITHFNYSDNAKFIDNVLERAEEDYNNIDYWVKFYSNDKSIKNIIIVTHTLPLYDFLDTDNKDPDSGSHINSKMKNITNNKKVTHWIFGHIHKPWDKTINGTRFISNPRGRPEDYDRIKYNIKNVIIT